MSMPRLSVLKHLAGWLLLILSITAVIFRFSLPVIGCGYLSPSDGQAVTALIDDVGLAFAILAFAVMGRVITLYRSENRIGWLIAGSGTMLAVANALDPYMRCALDPGSGLPFAGLSVWVTMIVGNIAIILLFVLLPALFPTGAFPTRSWKTIMLSAVAFILLLLMISAVAPGPMTMNGTIGPVSVTNPLGLPLPGLRRLETIVFYGIPLSEVLSGLIGIAAFIARFHRSSGDERQQLKWFAFFLVAVVAIYLVGFEMFGGLFYPSIFEHWSYGIALTLVFSGFPLVIGLAVFKYRLYDIDLVIRRTLQYTLLTGLLSGVYFGGVALAQALLTAGRGPSTAGGMVDSGPPSAVIVLTTLLIYILFNPLRRRLQDFIDRRFYRQKYDAERALARFAEAARSQTDLDQLSDHLIGTVQETLQPEHLSLWLNPGQRKNGGFL